MDIGFQTRNREETELEVLLGARFVTKDKEPYPFHIGKVVGVHASNGTAIGVYQGLTDKEDIVLFPSVQYEKYPTDAYGEKVKMKAYWDEERPELIKYRVISGVSPIRKEHLDWIVQNIGRDFPQIESK